MTHERIRVLLVGREPSDKEWIESALGQPDACGCLLECSGDLTSAPHCPAREPPDVVLLDLSLPESAGLAALATARAAAPCAPIVVLVAAGSEALGLDAVRAGAHDYLVKGEITASALHRSIRCAVERHRAERDQAAPSLRDRLNRLQMLKKLHEKFETSLDLKPVYRWLYEAMPVQLPELDIQRVSLLLYDEACGALVSGHLIGAPEPGADLISRPQPAGLSISGKCFAEGRPIVVDDCSKTDLIPREYVESLGLKATAAIPIVAKGSVLGVLRLDKTRQARPFSEGDIEFFTMVAEQLGIMLRVVRLLDERTQAENALRESEERFRLVITHAHDGINVCELVQQPGDPGWTTRRLLFCNDRFVEMSGRTREELESADLNTLVRPCVGAAERAERNRRAFAGEAFGGVSTWLRPDGKENYHEWVAVPIPIEGERYVLGIDRDITERRQTEERERRRREMLERVLRLGKSVMRVTDLRSCLLGIHESVRKDLGFDRVGIWLCDEGCSVFRGTFGTSRTGEVIDEWGVSYAATSMWEGLSDPGGIRHVMDFETAFNSCRDGIMAGVREHAIAPLWAGNEPVGILSVDNLLTQRPMAEEQLDALRLFAGYAAAAIANATMLASVRDAEARYRSIFENATEGIVQLAPDGRFISANPAAAGILGYESPEDLVRSVPDAAQLLVDPLQRDRFAQLMEGRDAAVGVEFRACRRSGEAVWISANIRAIRDPAGALARFEATLQDVTERKQGEEARARLEEELRQAQKMEAVGRLAGGVAHDFNNLLLPIMSYSHLLMDLLAPSDPRRRYAEEIAKTADRAASLPRQLLAFGRKQILQPKVLDLNALLEDVGKMLSRLISENVELALLPGRALGRVRADPGQVEQVIVNLALNARDAMPDGGRLVIETENAFLDEEYARAHQGAAPGAHVVVAVSDTGCGMDEETQARIFEPFFTTKELGKGTGLGLSTAYGIIAQSGGHIQVCSAPGHGTAFRIYLPQVEVEVEAAAVEAHDARAVPEGGGETILLVEDHPGVRAAARETLEIAGYTVIEAADGEEAVRVEQQHLGTIHLVLTDVVMPRMDGATLAKHLASRRPGIGVLYMSGYTDDVTIVRQSVLEERVAFLQKPFAPREVIRKVREVLEAKR